MQGTQERRKAPSAEVQAALLVLFAAACFVGMTSSVKYLSDTLSTPQIVWGRYATHFIVVLVILKISGVALLATDRPALQAARSLFMFGATALSFLALRYLPLAEVAAIMFLTPMLVTALAAVILREAVGVRRWMAVVIGFLGALIIIRPGIEAFHVAALAAVGCTACYAFYQITTRIVRDSAPPLVSLFYSSLAGTAVSTAALPFFWSTPDLQGWVLMALSGAFGAIGHLAVIAALGRAQASFVTPFSYSQLIWATIAGYALFGDLPDLWTFIGAGLIATSGLYVVHRERARATQSTVTPG